MNRETETAAPGSEVLSPGNATEDRTSATPRPPARNPAASSFHATQTPPGITDAESTRKDPAENRPTPSGLASAPASPGASTTPLSVAPPSDQHTTTPGGFSFAHSSSPPSSESTSPRFSELELLGQGATGSVFRAFDLRLERRVALKLLQHDDPELSARFLQEARAQARLQHPHICRIFEVGEHAGAPCIVMQYVGGGTLKQVRERLSVEQKVRVIRQTAEALHEAHRHGIVHRDVKPANILLEHTGTGGWHPYVADFGLAKLMDQAGRTMAGEILGTPAYMAPEQAAANIRAIDRRSDVYALGATLYDLLAGRPPFVHRDMLELLLLVRIAEPEPLRRFLPEAPQDLEAIVSKCLEKDPALRYPSARALAEDLQRYLDGEAVQARSPGFAERWSRKLRKHKKTAAVLGLIFAVIGTLIGWTLHERWKAAQSISIAQEFALQVKELEWWQYVEASMPLHDLRAGEARQDARIQKIRQRMAEIGPLATGPGYLALGRALLALGRLDEARVQLELAARAGENSPQLDQALALTLVRLYDREIEELRGIPSKADREVRRTELDTDLRDQATRLVRSQSAQNQELPFFREAILARLEGRKEEAAQLASKAAEASPWLYEASLLEARIYQTEFSLAMTASQSEAALLWSQKAETAYQRALEIGRSDWTGHVERCRLRAEVLHFAIVYQSQSNLLALHQAALDACNQALRLAPHKALSHQLLANLWTSWGRTSMDPKEVVAALDFAIESAQEAVRLAPYKARPLDSLGRAYAQRGELELSFGNDPLPFLERSATAFRQAMRLQPAYYHANLGTTLLLQAEARMQRSGNPLPDLEEALREAQITREREPNHPNPLNLMGNIHATRAEYEASQGQDPQASLEAAVQSYRGALQISPSSGYYHNNLTTVFEAMARYQSHHGQDPAQALADGLQHSNEAVRILPDWTNPPYNRGTLALAAADHELRHGRDPSGKTAAAREAFQHSLELQADAPMEIEGMAAAWLTEAAGQLDRGQAADRSLKEASQALQRSVQLRQPTDETRLLQAQLALLEASCRPQNDLMASSALPLLESATKTLAALLEQTSAGVQARRMLAESQLCSARAQIAAPALAEASLAQAEQSLQALGTRDDQPAETAILRAEGALLRARLASDPAQRQTWAAAAQQDFQKALRLDAALGPRLQPRIDQAVPWLGP